MEHKIVTWCVSLPAEGHLEVALGWEPRCGNNPSEASAHYHQFNNHVYFKVELQIILVDSTFYLNIYLGIDDEGRVPRVAPTFGPDEVEGLQGNVHCGHARIVLVPTTIKIEHFVSRSGCIILGVLSKVLECSLSLYTDVWWPNNQAFILWPCTKLPKAKSGVYIFGFDCKLPNFGDN